MGNGKVSSPPSINTPNHEMRLPQSRTSWKEATPLELLETKWEPLQGHREKSDAWQKPVQDRLLLSVLIP